jgi:predicted HTH domain antitoxin
MQTLGIKDLQINPAKLTKSLENDEFVLITKRGKALGVATSFGDEALNQGLKSALLTKAYKQGDLSLGQLSTALKMSKKETMNMLSMLGIDVIDYDFKDDLKTLEKLF